MNVSFDLDENKKPCVFCNTEIELGDYCKRCLTDE